MYAYPSLRFMRSAFLGIFSLIAMLLSGAAPATAQTADPRWGYLAELAEHDFEGGPFIIAWRWKVPNQIISRTVWGNGGRQVSEFELEPATGAIIVRREAQRNYFETQTGWKAGADRVLTDKGKIYITRLGTGGYSEGRSTWLPIVPGHKKEASVAKIIARGELRAANPGLMTTVQVAQAQQPVSAALSDPVEPDSAWGFWPALAGWSFRNGETGTVNSFYWSEPNKVLIFEAATAKGLINGKFVRNEDKSISILQDGRSVRGQLEADGSFLIPQSPTNRSRYRFDGNLWITNEKLQNGEWVVRKPSKFYRLPAAGANATKQPQTLDGASLSGPRLALVIGNSTYGPSMGALPNPANDADAMAAALKSLGFTVHLVKNADQNTMKRAISRFGQRLTAAGKGATGLFFYAGHGIQHRGINYLVPVNAEIASKADVDIEAVAADTVLQQMEEAGSSTNIVILDACRNMPLARGFRSAATGLAPMDAPNGSFIAYSTAPGSVAADGAGGNSPFVTALIRNIGRKGEPIESIFRDVRRSVRSETEGAQTPWDSSSLVEPFYFAGQ